MFSTDLNSAFHHSVSRLICLRSLVTKSFNGSLSFLLTAMTQQPPVITSASILRIRTKCTDQGLSGANHNRTINGTCGVLASKKGTVHRDLLGTSTAWPMVCAKNVLAISCDGGYLQKRRLFRSCLEMYSPTPTHQFCC